MVQQNSQTRRAPTYGRHHRLVLELIGLYVLLLPFPVVVELAGGGAILTGPSDLVLLVLIAVGVWGAVIVPGAWSAWHIALLFVPTVSALGVALLNRPLPASVVLAKVFGLIALFVLYMLVTSAIRSWGDIRRIARIFVNVVIWVNLISTLLFVAQVQVPLINLEPRRLSGLSPDPNAYGGLLLVALALAIPTELSTEPLVRGRLGRIGLFVLPLSVLLTNSRSAWIGLGAILLIVAVLRPRVWLKYVLVSTLVLLLVGLLISPDLTTDQIALADRGTSSRFVILDQAGEAFWSSPVVGIGLGQFATKYGPIIHSTGPWFLGEFGLIGFVVLAGFLMTFVRWAWAVYRTQPEPNQSLALGLLTAFVAMAAFSLGIEALYQRWWWLVMALIGSMHALASTPPGRLTRQRE